MNEQSATNDPATPGPPPGEAAHPGEQLLEEKKIALERYKATLNFWKFMGASVFAAIAIAAIPPGFQWATFKLEEARKLRELQQTQAAFHENYVKDFVEKALNQDIEIRIRLATYFEFVSEASYQPGWAAYLQKIEGMRNTLRTEINHDERQLFEFEQSASGNPADIAELKRNLAWKYGELGYSPPDRDVVRDPRAAVFRPLTNFNETVFDLVSNTTSIASCLAATGVKYVARYYKSSTSPFPSMSREEVATLATNGIRVIAVQEGRSTTPAYFSDASGTQIAKETFESARRAGQPGGTPIFFAVDYDASNGEIDSNIKPFFESIKRANKELDQAQQYRIGVYGSGAVIQRLRDADLVELVWLAAPVGWAGSQKARSDQKWDLMQAPGVDANLPCGLNSQTVINSRLKGTEISFSTKS